MPMIEQVGPFATGNIKSPEGTTPVLPVPVSAGTFATKHQTFVDQVSRFTTCFKASDVIGFTPEELYDHQNDPYEWDNLANENNIVAIKQELRKSMFEIINGSN